MDKNQMFVASKLLEKNGENTFAVGTHHVDGVFTVKVRAVVTRQEDGESKPTAALLSKDTLAQFIARLGAVQEQVLKCLEETWEATLTGAEPRRIDDAVQARIDASLGKFDRMVDRLPKIPKKGATKVAGTIEIVSEAKEAA